MGNLEERIFMWLASKMPEQLCYCCFVRVMLHATTGKYSDTEVLELNAMAAMNRFANDRKL